MENGGSVDGTGSLPLDDIRVVDLTIARAGPQCVRQLADWGADVVRIEHPADPAGVGGSDARNLHRNKRTVALDLKGGGAIEQLLLLTDHADVFVENMRPSVKQRLGIGWEVLHRAQPTARVRIDLGLRARRAVRRSWRRRSDRTGHGRADERHRASRTRSRRGRASQ